MDKSIETALVAVLVILILLAVWYFLFRKKKCSLTSDCSKGETCGSDGYCHKSSS